MNSSNLELKIAIMVSMCIVGVLWLLWRKFRVRRPPKKQEPAK